VLLVILIVLLAGRGRERRMHQREVARLTNEATQEENQKNYGAAVGRIDAALAEAATIQPRDDAQITELRTWRNRMARREVESQFTTIARLCALGRGRSPGRARCSRQRQCLAGRRDVRATGRKHQHDL
jgi:hypothetical protein